MPITPLLSRQLKESLGPDTGEGLVAWMEQTDNVRGDLSVMRAESQDFRREMQEFRRDMKEMRLALEARMDIGFANTEARLERRISDLMKWSFVFWCGAVAAIAALAGVLK